MKRLIIYPTFLCPFACAFCATKWRAPLKGKAWQIPGIDRCGNITYGDPGFRCHGFADNREIALGLRRHHLQPRLGDHVFLSKYPGERLRFKYLESHTKEGGMDETQSVSNSGSHSRKAAGAFRGADRVHL